MTKVRLKDPKRVQMALRAINSLPVILEHCEKTGDKHRAKAATQQYHQILKDAITGQGAVSKLLRRKNPMPDQISYGPGKWITLIWNK